VHYFKNSFSLIGLFNDDYIGKSNDEYYQLFCTDVYHWACLDQFARQLPPTTAPAGYKCPSCKVGLFPSINLVSPVADVLREKLAGVNWARTGLGLPLVSSFIFLSKKSMKVG
jgi:hypothetical protein